MIEPCWRRSGLKTNARRPKAITGARTASRLRVWIGLPFQFRHMRVDGNGDRRNSLRLGLPGGANTPGPY
jgi:hypothetical protein